MKRALTIILSIALALGLNVASASITPPTTAVEPNANWQLFIFADDRVSTASWNSTAALTIPYSACALQYTSAISTANPITITIQGSNNGKDWVSFTSAITSNISTALNDVYQFNTPPTQYVRVSTTLLNSNNITLTYYLSCR